MFDALWERYPHAQLTACGSAVGLPEGQMGNSEVGHLNLGAGSVIKQDLMRIDEAVEDGTLFDNEVLQDALRNHQRVHLLGLVSDGGVHSSLEHLRAMTEMALGDVIVHAFTDGRDNVAVERLALPPGGRSWGTCRVGSVMGRFLRHGPRPPRGAHAGRRDAMVVGKAEHHAESGEAAVRAAYERGESDEFIVPTLVGSEQLIGQEDSVVCFNFRPDRMRQLVVALDDLGMQITTLTEYEEDFDYPVAFPPARPAITLPHVIADAGGKQLHVAETEKYPHVTYFFGGGEEEPYAGERREPRPVTARRADLRPQARDERQRPPRTPSSRPGPRTSRASGSSTSPTPTWSATPASSPPRSPRSRPSTPASAAWSRPSRRPAACW